MEVVGQPHWALNMELKLELNLSAFVFAHRWNPPHHSVLPFKLPLTIKVTNDQGKSLQYTYDTLHTNLVNTGTLL